MFKPIPVSIKKKILTEIKEGLSVIKAGEKYNVSPKTIYGWLVKKSLSSISLIEYSRLKRERDDLLKIISELTLEISQSKKEG